MMVFERYLMKQLFGMTVCAEILFAYAWRILILYQFFLHSYETEDYSFIANNLSV
jgi:hypothetical protein